MASTTNATATPSRRLPGPGPVGRLRYLRALMGKPYDGLLDLHARYGPVVRFGYGRREYVLLFGAEANRVLLTDNPARPNFLSRDVLTLLIPVVGAKAMVVSDGEDH